MGHESIERSSRVAVFVSWTTVRCMSLDISANDSLFKKQGSKATLAAIKRLSIDRFTRAEGCFLSAEYASVSGILDNQVQLSSLKYARAWRMIQV